MADTYEVEANFTSNIGILDLASSTNFDGKPSYHPERKGQLNISKLKNWVEKNGGLPTYINSLATGILRSNPGWSISRVIATAVNMAKKMCAGSRTGIVKKVSAAVKAAACKAVAQWEAKKAKASEEWVDELILQMAEEGSGARQKAELRVNLRNKAAFVPSYLELTDDDYMKYAYGIELTEEENTEMLNLIEEALEGGD